MDSSPALFLVLVVLAAGFAALTKPDRNGFAPELLATIQRSSTPFANRDDSPQELAARSARNACYRSLDDCAEKLREAEIRSLDESDYVLWRSVSLDKDIAFGCIGVYGAWICWKS